MTPKVSVIIPTYNRLKELNESVRIALAQLGADVEVIIVDDASTDATKEFIELLQPVFSNITCLRHDTNRGVSAARNTGIQAATGEYIAFLDSDDMWDNEKLFKQIADIETASPYRKEDTFSFTYHFDKRADNTLSLPLYWGYRGKSKTLLYIYDDRELEHGVLGGHLWFGIGSTLLAHRDAIHKNGLFNETLGCGEDTEYVFRHLVGGGKIRVVPEPLMTYTLPEKGKSYSGDLVYQGFLIDRYRCEIAKGWGEDVAHDFILTYRASYAARAKLTQKQWRQVAAEILPVSTDAPCRKGFDCALRGKFCAANDLK